MDRVSISDYRRFLQHKPRKRQKTAFIGDGLLVDMKNEPKKKFHNKMVVRHGIRFDSIKEADRWDFLVLMERQGIIRNLQRQVWLTILPDEYEEVPQQLKTKVRMVRRRSFIGVRYRADFVYEKDGKTVYEDLKSTKDRKKWREGAVDDVFQLKMKMLHCLLGIDLKIVDSPSEAV